MGRRGLRKDKFITRSVKFRGNHYVDKDCVSLWIQVNLSFCASLRFYGDSGVKLLGENLVMEVVYCVFHAQYYVFWNQRVGISSRRILWRCGVGREHGVDNSVIEFPHWRKLREEVEMFVYISLIMNEGDKEMVCGFINEMSVYSTCMINHLRSTRCQKDEFYRRSQKRKNTMIV